MYEMGKAEIVAVVKVIKNLLPSILSPGQSPDVLRTDSHALWAGRRFENKN